MWAVIVVFLVVDVGGIMHQDSSNSQMKVEPS